MNNFKDKILDISNSNSINVNDKILIGVIKDTDEVSNMCSVDIITQYGEIISQHLVPVETDTNNGLIGWFPAIGDKVYVRTKTGNQYEIVSLYTEDYASKHRHKIDVSNNLLSNFYNYTLGGNIF